MPNVAEDIQEIFRKMPQAFQPEKAPKLSAVIQLNLTGDGGGQWAVKIAGGKISIDETEAASPDLTLTMSAGDYVALSHGEANPMNLFMAGKIKLQGDLGLAMKFSEMFTRG